MSRRNSPPSTTSVLRLLNAAAPMVVDTWEARVAAARAEGYAQGYRDGNRDAFAALSSATPSAPEGTPSRG